MKRPKEKKRGKGNGKEGGGEEGGRRRRCEQSYMGSRGRTKRKGRIVEYEMGKKGEGRKGKVRSEKIGEDKKTG